MREVAHLAPADMAFAGVDAHDHMSVGHAGGARGGDREQAHALDLHPGCSYRTCQRSEIRGWRLEIKGYRISNLQSPISTRHQASCQCFRIARTSPTSADDSSLIGGR